MSLRDEYARPRPVILSDDHILCRNSLVSRRNLGEAGVVGQVLRGGRNTA
jgi:hypothetical protein